MKMKVDTQELTLGMYVDELDRPWVESPFLFQGFKLETLEQLEQVQQVCQYVYVDTEQSPQNVRYHLQTLSNKLNSPGKASQRNFTETSTFKLNKQDDKVIQTAFKQQVVKAKKLRNKTRQYIDKVLDDVRLGSSVDTASAKQIVSELVDSIVSNVDASMWLTQLKSRDEYTAIHSVNVCILSITFGRSLGISKQDLNVLGLGALLHDMGKMKVPAEVLNKPGKLTDEEFEVMKSHPGLGYKILKDDESIPQLALDIVLSHHERLNGGGYPYGLADHNINYFTRIVSIVDVYDAITSDRVYHDGMAPHQALKNMYKWTPGNYDQELMEAFIKTIGIYPIGSILELRSGHVGMVVKINEDEKLKPVVMLLLNREKHAYPRRKLVNLANPHWQKKSTRIKRIVDASEYGINVTAILEEESRFVLHEAQRKAE